jgi:hypothetical protein
MSVYQHATNRFKLTYLHEVWYLEIVKNPGEKIQFALKSDEVNGTLGEDQYTFLSFLAHFVFEWNMFQHIFSETENTHFVFCRIFS